MSIKQYALGLDVSTSCTGICLIDISDPRDILGNYILDVLDRIEFKKCVTLWDKADHVASTLQAIKAKWCNDVSKIKIIAIEEPLMGFRPGMSSAATITTLMRFNGMVSYIARNTFNVEPTYINSAHARKLCGIKLQKRAVCGKDHKQQVFDHMSQNDLKHITWPTKARSIKIVDWAKDATDAYVIARASCLINKR